MNGAWQLIDGRNRLAACKMVGVTPTYRVLTSDPTAYILSANVHRRHLTKGQQAMVTAMAYPNPERRGGRRDRGQSSKNEDCCQISSGNLSMARYVLRNNLIPEGQQYPDRCLAVMAGSALQVSPTRAREHL